MSARWLAAAMVVTLTGCGAGGGSADVAPGGSADGKAAAGQDGASAEGAASPEPAERVLSSGEWKVKNVTIQDRVVALKGQAVADEARDLAISVAKDYGFNEQSVKYTGKNGKQESREWMLGARSLMTADAAANWTKTVNTYFAEKKLEGTKAWRDMMSFTNYGLYKESMLPPDLTTPLMSNRAVKELEVDLSSDGRVWVTMVTVGDFSYVNDGRNAVSRLTHSQQFWLEQVGGSLKIDGWNGNLNMKVI